MRKSRYWRVYFTQDKSRDIRELNNMQKGNYYEQDTALEEEALMIPDTSKKMRID
jgi:hypothetical protein